MKDSHGIPSHCFLMMGTIYDNWFFILVFPPWDTKPLFPDGGGTIYDNWFFILLFPMKYKATMFPDEGEGDYV